MGKKSKSKPSEEPDSSDIFKLLFGREAPEEQGLGFANPKNGEIVTPLANTYLADSDKVKKTKRKKELNAELIDEKEERRKRKKEAKPDSDVDSVVTVEEVKSKKKRKENEAEIGSEIVPVVEKDEVAKALMEKKKKKRKRDELEEAYEAKAYGVVPVVEEGGKGRKVGEKRKTADDPAELMVCKEGFDDESKLLRTVFVGNLPLKLKKKVLLKEFSNFGEIDSVRIRSVPLVDSKTPRKGAIMKGKINESVDSVNAYIVFKDEKSAQASLSHNMAVVGGNHIRVDKACPPRKKMKGDNTPVYDNQRTVFVGNLPFDVKDEEIYQLFCGINPVESNIEAVRVVRDPNSSAGKGIAYVLFKTREAVNLVLRKRNLKIRDRLLRLYHAKADATPSKKRNLAPTSTDNSSSKRFAVTSGTREDQNRPKMKTALSYQGLKASKSIQKKDGPRKEGYRPRTGEQRNQKPSTAVGMDVKQRKSKRPAVAARKAKAVKGAAASRQTGVKRKPEIRTPDSFNRIKRARKF